jgi:hypothetical protein
VTCLGHLEVRALQGKADDLPDVRLVVYHEDGGHDLDPDLSAARQLGRDPGASLAGVGLHHEDGRSHRDARQFY